MIIGGITLGYNPRSIKLVNIWGGIEFIGADTFSMQLGTDIRLINVYGPCHHQEDFGDHLQGSDIMQLDTIILGGDLNFSLGYSKYWGHQAQVDPLSAFFEHLLETHIYIDIPSTKLVLT